MGDCEIVSTVIFVVGVVTIVSFALAVYTQVELSRLEHDGTTVLEHHDQQIKEGIKVTARHDKEVKELQQTVSNELLPALSQLQEYLGQALFLCKICVVFRPVLEFRDLLFIHASTNATDDHKYSPFPSQILTVPKFWYHLAHSFSRKNVPFDFERAF